MEANATRIIEPIKVDAYKCPVCDVTFFTDLETAKKHVNKPLQPV